ncbi:Ig-like domain-containing protein [Alloprevotella sp. Lung230]|uniref:Ig-like domain-containing protein n=1 Tax=Alloprevotella sp. Lung230 TaxID=2766595 RepID=UPI001655EB8E|nr:Ig-like domain-containing protein [Alloprevotella sp. Lung230]MBC8626343.1 Ig-like domain-containing protein [Alloprevotella sp. Lung230]
MKRIPFLFLLLLAALAAVVGCANQGSGPDGGPYDETPPRIVSATNPEKVAGGKRTKFTLVFDELIKVDNANEKITVSPPQKEQPEIKVSGRRVTVEILDSLIPNTTYTVDFSDAITDNNEGNPLGQYTYIFSTGAVTDTMQISGHVLNAEDLEPMKGILVGLHTSDADTAFTRTPFERVARTDGQGYFSIKGVSPTRKYRIFALQDADADYRFSQPSEIIGFLDKKLVPSSFPDTRYDTLWIDSVRYDSIRVIPFTHFTPDDVVVTAFKEARQPRHFLKAQRDVPEQFTTFFTAPSTHVPTLRGLNFKSENAFVENRNLALDTLTYWLADTTLLRQDTLRLAYTFEEWDDSLQRPYLKTDTLELVPRTTFAKRLAEKAKELEKWEKQRERRHKRGDYTDEKPPVVFLPTQLPTDRTISPAQNLTLKFEQPLARLDTTRIHLRLKVDSTFREAPFELDSLPGNLLARRLRAEWRPGQQYELHLESGALTSLYGLSNDSVRSSFSIGKLEDYGTLFVSLSQASDTTIVQLLDQSGNPTTQVLAQDGRAEFYYIRPGKYFLRCFFDHNGDGRWTPGRWDTHTPPEEVYYYPEEIEVRANWDSNPAWNVKALPLNKQKPARLIKQKEQKRQNNTHQRNIDRLRQRGGR